MPISTEMAERSDNNVAESGDSPHRLEIASVERYELGDFLCSFGYNDGFLIDAASEPITHSTQ
jgi:hypothetical protein